MPGLRAGSPRTSPVNHAIAEEATQAAWVIAWRKLGNVRDEAHLRPWLVSMAANEAKRLLRKRRRRAELEVAVDLSEAPGGIDPATGVAEIDLDEAMATLGPDDRELLAMRYVAGAFVANEILELWVEFNEDGTCRWHRYLWDNACTYAVAGELFTETTFEPRGGQPQVPATYYWDYVGERLAFELWGEDMDAGREDALSNTFRLVPDPREVVVAIRDIPAGDPVHQRWTILSIVSAEAGSDALTYVPDVHGSVAAVPISKGQAITPDLLEPIPE